MPPSCETTWLGVINLAKQSIVIATICSMICILLTEWVRCLFVRFVACENINSYFGSTISVTIIFTILISLFTAVTDVTSVAMATFVFNTVISVTIKRVTNFVQLDVIRTDFLIDPRFRLPVMRVFSPFAIGLAIPDVDISVGQTTNKPS